MGTIKVLGGRDLLSILDEWDRFIGIGKVNKVAAYIKGAARELRDGEMPNPSFPYEYDQEQYRKVLEDAKVQGVPETLNKDEEEDLDKKTETKDEEEEPDKKTETKDEEEEPDKKTETKDEEEEPDDETESEEEDTEEYDPDSDDEEDEDEEEPKKPAEKSKDVDGVFD